MLPMSNEGSLPAAVPVPTAGGGSAVMTGWRTLFYKEILRFWRVGFQTVGAPVLTAILYLLVFAHALAAHVQTLPGVTYVQFLIPGLAMMAMLGQPSRPPPPPPPPPPPTSTPPTRRSRPLSAATV